MVIGKGLKIILSLLIIALLAGLFMFYKTWYMPHRDAKDETAIIVTAQQIIDAYASDEKNANALYLDKAIEVSGEIEEIKKTAEGKTVVILKGSDPMSGIRCTMKDNANVKAGQTVKIKGICSGYLMDVTIIDCYIVE